ncbi:hypothetical protein TWF730_009759 [Orbilia blumenaviensis]|uniref:Uncharacterized protein n=1 Tax=Orbilia blumenaviensis TaxID=1796055 RepID=A0AAV9UTK7_9PEZI
MQFQDFCSVEPDWNDTAYENLVLPEGEKELLMAFELSQIVLESKHKDSTILSRTKHKPPAGKNLKSADIITLMTSSGKIKSATIRSECG